MQNKIELTLFNYHGVAPLRRAKPIGDNHGNQTRNRK